MAAIAYDGTCVGFAVASANYSSAAAQYRIVRLTTAATPTFALATAANRALGILQDTPASGEPGQIQIDGISRVRVLSTGHAAITPGTLLVADGSGGATVAAAANAFTDYVIGTSLEILSSTTTGIIGVLITHQGSRGSTA